jgi:hypothetical protein
MSRLTIRGRYSPRKLADAAIRVPRELATVLTTSLPTRDFSVQAVGDLGTELADHFVRTKSSIMVSVSGVERTMSGRSLDRLH